MFTTCRHLALFTGLVCLASLSAWAAGAPDSAERLAAQREALKPLASLDGTWRGQARTVLADGKEHEFTQTERVGTMLGGAVRVIEGRGYAADGSLVFNAFGVISYEPRSKSYSLRSYAEGFIGDFPVEVTPEGLRWFIKAGPATIRYTVAVKDGVWKEVGERLVEGQPPVRTLEMELRRIGDSDWPRGGVVEPK